MQMYIHADISTDRNKVKQPIRQCRKTETTDYIHRDNNVDAHTCTNTVEGAYTRRSTGRETEVGRPILKIYRPTGETGIETGKQQRKEKSGQAQRNVGASIGAQAG